MGTLKNLMMRPKRKQGMRKKRRKLKQNNMRKRMSKRSDMKR